VAYAKIIKTIKDVKEEDWNRLVSTDDIQMSYNYIKSIENSEISDYQHRYILIYDDRRELIASLPVFITNRFYLDTPLTGKSKILCKKIRNVLPMFLRKRVLFCGCCISEYNKINIKEDVAKDKVIKLMLDEIDLMAKREKIKFVIAKDFIDSGNYFLEESKKKGYFDFCSLPSTYIDIDCDSFEDYIQGLKIKQRQNIRNKINKCKKAGGIDLEVVEEFGDISPKLHELYMNTFNNAEVQFDRIGKDFFDNINNLMGDSSRVILAKKDGNIVGFALLVCSQGSCVNIRIGLDYKYAHLYHVYFMIHYKNIEYAIKSGAKRLYLSQTTYIPKLEMGAKIAGLTGFVRHRNRFINMIYKFLFRKLFSQYQSLSRAENPYNELKLMFSDKFSGKTHKKSA
jgi:predicted N-acyltransferase